MVHYMPWYQTPEVSGYWGWHWTMNHFNPESISADGRRDIASQYYPLTGPYDSQDPDILEYQVLLMKLSGIDGVIVDWYGMDNFWDYGTLNKSTNSLFSYIKKAHLKFALCYEDQTVKHMVENDYLKAENALDHGRDIMLYAQDNWFRDDAYLKLNDRPLLLTFGPQYFYESSDWDYLFSVLDMVPAFFTLENRLETAAVGGYPWPPMWASVDGVLSMLDLNKYLNAFYQKSDNWDNLVASAFPTFNDIYEQAGVGDSYGFLDPMDGFTLLNTLSKALYKNPDVLQIVTWNDYGEGTIVEPTREFGYRYLEIIQETKVELTDSVFSHTSEDLKIPKQIYDLRKENKNSMAVNRTLDSVFDLIINGDISVARFMIDSLSNTTGITDEWIHAPREIDMSNCYPNPFNAVTSFEIKIDNPAKVEITVHDILGKKVAALLNKKLASGSYQLQWSAVTETSGIYFITIKSETFQETKKVFLIK
ncbi:MAG: T9SS type A sorting domain-containing protein [Calditrichae bacterium]|nr:T9SS type A sorting domain-containing protein [Calditrichia bacterium]